MAGFDDIIGHEQIIEHLQNAIELDKVSHAYIINGEKGTGKMLLADAFALTLQCEKQERIPCLKCRSCKQTLSGNQPDIIHVTHEKPGSISVDEIRTQLNNDIQVKPYSSPRKIYIIDEADKLTVQAQNALLKTIEEPPEYAVIVMLTSNADALLPTILSRCVLLNIKPVKDAVLKRYLMERLKVPDYKADLSIAFARGNVGKAVALASSENFDVIKKDALDMLRYLEDMEIHEVVAWVKKMADYKLEINDFLDILTVWFRDVLLFKATNDVNMLIFKNEIKEIKKKAAHSSYSGLEEIVNAIEKAKVRLNANVNFDLTIELMLLTIKEN
ncbi:MAG: AAA family ATPase [Lachnospiraceae bacterium]|nr:AAA family ATPase [Lachnospiraceae bacterium]